jgi:hypothetical protein
MVNGSGDAKQLQPTDHRVRDIIKHLEDTFEPHEYHALLLQIINKKAIRDKLTSVVNATGI